MNRLAIVQVSSHFLHQLLGQGTPEASVVKDGLPDDALLVAVHSDGRTVSLTYQSDAFDEVPDGRPIPQLCPMYRDERSDFRSLSAGYYSIDDLRKEYGLSPLLRAFRELAREPH